MSGAHRALDDPADGAVAAVPVPPAEPSPADASLGSSVRRGVGWTALTRIVIQVAQFGSTIVLARLLDPNDFGLASLVAVVTGFANVFVDLGLGAAIVQRLQTTQTLLTTAFWLNFWLGWLLFGLTASLAYPLARLFDQSDMVYLTPVAALSFAVSLSVVPRAILQRRLDFRRLGLIDAATAICAVVVSIAGAAMGFGAIALVVGTVAGAAAGTVTAALAVRWRPSGRATRADLGVLWAYSKGLLGFGIINYWSRNADNLLVGRYLGTAQLGFYARAYNIAVQPVSQMSNVLTSVLFPALSSLQRDLDRFRAGWYLSCKTAFVVAAPVAIGIVTAAPAFVTALYGERWLPMVGALSFLCAAVPFSIIGSNTGPVFQSLGRTGLQFKLGLVQTAMTLTAIIIGLQFGITAIAFGLLVRSGLNVGICIRFAIRLIDGRASMFLQAFVRPILAVALMAAASLAVRLLLTEAPPGVVLAAQVITCGGVYGVALYALDRGFIRNLRGARRRATVPRTSAP